MAQIGETELDMRALSGALWRRAWLLILIALIVGGVTYVGLRFVEPLYTADTRILIEERESPLTRPREQGADPANEFDESAIQSQVEVLRSREIANAVIDKLDLTHRPELDPAKHLSLTDSLMITLGLREHPAEESIRQRVMDTYSSRLTVYALEKSRVIGVEFVAPSPALAADVANEVAAAFVALQQDAKRQSALAATEWLQQEIERLRGRVAEAEQAVAAYRTKNGLFDSSTSGSLSQQQLGDLNAELARARAARAEAEARANLIQSLLHDSGSLDATQEVLDSPLIQRLRERQVALRAQIAELAITMLPGHPRLQALQGQLGNLDSQIRQEAEKVLASLKTAARVAAAREESLVTSLNQAKTSVSKSNEQEIQLRALEREATAQRDLLESFLGRYREAVARTDADYLPADARIISRAVPPEQPSYPKKTMMAIAAAVAALLLSAAIILIRQFTSGRAFRVIQYPDAQPVAAALQPIAPLPQPVAAPVPPVATPPAEAIVAAAAPPPDPVVAVVAPPAEEPAAKAPVFVRVADPGSSPIDAEPELEPQLAVADEPVEASAFAPAPLLEAEREPEPQLDFGKPAEEPFPPEAQKRNEEVNELPKDHFDSIGDDLDAVLEELEGEGEEADQMPPPLEVDSDHPGTAELAEILASDAVRVALFVGAEGGEGAGEIAFAAARHAARENMRFILLDVGMNPSRSLGGGEAPGMGDLLAGDAAFGEVIRRDETARVHFIPLGSIDGDPPLQRLQLAIGALTHTYDKVIVVADSFDDWPHEQVQPDLAALVFGPEATESLHAELYEAALQRGAHSALIVRYASEQDGTDGRRESQAA